MGNAFDYRLVLASGSPRRRELLAGLGIPFEVRLLPGVDESYPASLRDADIPLHISRLKAEAYRAGMRPDELVIAADTIVWLGEQVLGKPRDEEDARRMLRLLSGRTHEVYTGVTLLSGGGECRSFAAMTEVRFAPLAEEDICRYVAECRPLDKAGAYGIQEWIGYIGVESIRGSYFNVMGLPVQRLYRELCAPWPAPGRGE